LKNRVLRKITAAWRKLHNEECHDLCSSPVIYVINSRNQRWAMHAAHMEDKCLHGFGRETWMKETIWNTSA
jgi:hypothetical protein